MNTKLAAVLLAAMVCLLAVPAATATPTSGTADCGTIFEMCCDMAAMDPLNHPADVVLCLVFWVLYTII